MSDGAGGALVNDIERGTVLEGIRSGAARFRVLESSKNWDRHGGGDLCEVFFTSIDDDGNVLREHETLAELADFLLELEEVSR